MRAVVRARTASVASRLLNGDARGSVSMAQGPDIKIRALPRGSEKKTQTKTPAAPTARTPRYVVYVGAAATLLLSALLLAKTFNKPQTVVRAAAANQEDPANALVNRHLRDLEMKQEMRRQKQKLDALAMKDPSVTDDTAILSDPEKSYGVSLDSDKTIDVLYRDLNYRKPTAYDQTPEERISARLANRKWIREHERAERVNFVRNFIRSAYERGYQVEIDQNLVVVGVKKITEPKKVNIEQIIDRMARQSE